MKAVWIVGILFAASGQSSEELHRLGRAAYLDEKDYVKAEQMFRKALAANPKSSAAHNSMGNLLYWVKRDFAGAETCWKKALSLDPKNPDAARNLGVLYRRIGKTQMRQALVKREAVVKRSGETAGATMWDEYNADYVAPDKISVTVSPDRSLIKMGEEISFSVKVGAKGYLALLERGVSGKINLIYPYSSDPAEGLVEPGKIIGIPEDNKAFIADAPGVERLKAFLFSSKEGLAAMMKGFDVSRSQTREELKASLSKIKSAGRFKTSEISFEVVDPKKEGGKP